MLVAYEPGLNLTVFPISHYFPVGLGSGRSYTRLLRLLHKTLRRSDKSRAKAVINRYQPIRYPICTRNSSTAT